MKLSTSASTGLGASHELGGVAQRLQPLVVQMLGEEVPISFAFWDGSVIEVPAPVATLRFRSEQALRRLLWQPTELGVARAHIAGELDVDGDIFATLAALRDALGARPPGVAALVPAWRAAARSIGGLGRPPEPPPEEVRMSGVRRHTIRRDSAAVGHHYDVGNEFYRLVLGAAMTYSCARFVDATTSLETAQASKHELICRKLGLHERPGQRLLDVGCGWGSMVIHAATHHGVRAVGITISREQFEMARQRVAEAGVDDRVEIRLQDYRELGGERFDAISSVGMSEHVGASHLDRYFEGLHRMLVRGGRLLNHAISSPGGSKIAPRSFIGRYVFPDGELIDVATTAAAMERAGFEVRDVEALREHYARTLRCWVANLERDWDRAVALVGQGRARVWRLYMAASAIAFEAGTLGLHQVLGVATAADGRSGMPTTRRDWATEM